MDANDLTGTLRYRDVRYRRTALRRALDEYEAHVRSAGPGPPDAAWHETSLRTAELQDVIVNQANHLRKALARVGLPLMDPELGLRVRHLRNLYEHWEKYRASFENPSHPKRDSAKWYAENFPDEAPWSSRWGRESGFEIGGIIHLRQLRELVTRVEEALASH